MHSWLCRKCEHLCIKLYNFPHKRVQSIASISPKKKEQQEHLFSKHTTMCYQGKKDVLVVLLLFNVVLF